MPKDTIKKKNNGKKEKKGFFKDFKGELKKVIWLTPKQVVNNTTAVLTIVLITALIVAILDIVFKEINSVTVNGLKKMVQTRNEIVSENTSEFNEVLNESNPLNESIDDDGVLTLENKSTDGTEAPLEEVAE